MTQPLFTPASGAPEPIDLIPAGTLAAVNVSNVKLEASKEHGGFRYDIELTVLTGKYRGRKIFDMFSCPIDPRNDKAVPVSTENPDGISRRWRNMAITGITRLLETAGTFIPSQPETYGIFNNLLPTDRPPTPEEMRAAALKIAHEISASNGCIKIKIEKGQDGHQDKNKVGEWLSSNPNSGGYKLYCELQQSVTQQTDAARPTAFGAPTTHAAPVAATGLAAPVPASAAPAPAVAAPAPAAAPAAPAPVAAPAAVPATPAAGAAAPSWLAEAQAAAPTQPY
jgi:hypothetical protein